MTLQVLCVGTGRDGTVSVSEMLGDVLEKEGLGRTCAHEWLSTHFYNCWCDYQDSGDITFIEEIERWLHQCSHACIVGNGYSQLLPTISKLFGRDLVLIRLRRRDRDACVRSLVKNAQLFPQNHRYYSESPLATGKRMAAFHFGEVKKEEWDRWSIEDRFYWYYDKTHALVDSYKHLFAEVVEIETEGLDGIDTRISLASALRAPAPIVPRSVHVNRHVDLEQIPEDMRPWIQTLLGRLNLARLGNDPIYGMEHFLSTITNYMSLQVDSISAQGPQQAQRTALRIECLLAGARQVLQQQLEGFEELSRRVASANRIDCCPGESSAKCEEQPGAG